MPTDLQIIDGFEALRQNFIEENPSVSLEEGAADAQAKAAKPSIEDVLEAWFRAVLSLNAEAPEQRRAITALVKMAMREPSQSARRSGREQHEQGVASLLKKHPGVEAQGRKVFQTLRSISDAGAIVNLPGLPLSASAEAAAWTKLLPKLGGMNVWRMLAHLGRPILVPEAPLRRFYWRLGLLEVNRMGSPRDAARVLDCTERTLLVTRFGHEQLRYLIDWHTRRSRTLKGGFRCGPTPQCSGCPFANGCTWFRFQGATPPADEAGSAAGAKMEKLKRRLASGGTEELDDAELLALLIHGGRDGQDPVGMSEDLLRRFGDLRALDLSSLVELQGFKGIGEVRAARLKVAFELGRRLLLHPLDHGATVSNSRDVWTAYRHRYRDIPQEHFITLLLNTKNRVLQTHLVSKGSLSSSPAHPRDVFKQAIHRSASAIILIHNHPSGDPEPSEDDIAITRRLVEAGKVLGIRVLDHIILGSETYYSFRDEGAI